jgi:reductive dehalogenase
VVIGVKMKWEMVRHAPGLPACTESMACYLRTGEIAATLARVIQRWGYAARPHLDGNYQVMCVPIAERAGLGETARNGLLVSPSYGSRLRLSVVTTDLPLDEDVSVNLGVQDFCSFCKKCATNCPSGAVDSGNKSVYKGVEKWQTDRDQCYRLWRNYGTDCALCIKVCPYSKPATFMHQLVRFGIARNALVRRLALWADDFLYGRRPKARYNLPQWHADENQTCWKYEEEQERKD